MKTLQQALNLAISSLTQEKVEIILESPKNPEHGDLSSPVAMLLARILKQSPLEIAKKIAEILVLPSEVVSVDVLAPGFLNFRYSDDFLISSAKLDLNEINNKTQNSYGKKVSLEHTAINPNKQAHVGHLRNACIGDSIKQLLSFLNYDLLTLYYHNDIGVQVAALVLATEVFDDKPSDYPSFAHYASEVYSKISSIVEQDLSLQKRQSEIHQAMLDPNSKYADTAYEITLKVLDDIFELMQKLSISYDLVVCESSIHDHKLFEETFNLLIKNKSFYKVKEGEREGCYVIDMPGNSEPKVIIRSNGVPTYAGNDIANHLWKFGIISDFKYKKITLANQNLIISSHTGENMPGFNQADSIINIIDQTQTYPQESVKQAFKALGYEEISKNYHHVNYGFVYLSRETALKLGLEVSETDKQVKISGRKGSVVLVSEMLEKMENSLREQFGEFQNLKALAIAAIKYEMLKVDTYKDLVFDLDRALDIKGNSGTYLMYTYARSCGILRKVFKDIVEPQKVELEGKEKALLLKISDFNNVVAKMHDSLAPNLMCNYLYELCQVYNSFYNDCKVIGSEKEDLRLYLVKIFGETLSQGLKLLGVQTVEEI